MSKSAFVTWKRALYMGLASVLLGLGVYAAAQQLPDSRMPGVEKGEFHFVRMIYRDLPQNRRWGRGWWSQDWPEAEEHFSTGVSRLTQLDVGAPVALDLLSEELFDYPWLYATQVGYWDLSNEEIDALREYLDRGGFLFVDDFFDREWSVFQQTMTRLYPNRPIIEIQPGSDDAVLHVVYDLDQSVQIPGLRHLGRGGFRSASLPEPKWMGIFDDKNRMVVAINYNMDIGDAWEHANDPRYPQPMTALSYRFAINYTIYAMTH